MASLRMFEAGAFSTDPGQPLRADGARLARLTADDIARGFQVSAENPLVGLEGRAALLRRLGETVLAGPAFAVDGARPGGLFDHLAGAADGIVPAAAILEALLLNLGPIWPGRLMLGGPAARRLLAPSARSRSRPVRRTGSYPSTSCRNGWPTA